MDKKLKYKIEVARRMEELRKQEERWILQTGIHLLSILLFITIIIPVPIIEIYVVSMIILGVVYIILLVVIHKHFCAERLNKKQEILRKYER